MVYLDNNATTRIDPRVIEAMMPLLTGCPSNPSSPHGWGRIGKQRLMKAREMIADYLCCLPQEIVFTSGGTEAMNLLIHATLNNSSAPHIITSNIEHACVYKTLQSYARLAEMTYLSVGPAGAPLPSAVEAAITPQTTAIILSAANSETGVKSDLEAISALAFQHQIPLIVDGVAWLGKEPVTLYPGITGMGFSGHKIHAPQGTGFAFIRKSLTSHPLLKGGNQEYGWRAGTENLPGIVGLATAVDLLRIELPEASRRMAYLRDTLESQLQTRFPPILVNGSGPRLPNTSNLTFPQLQGEDLLIGLDLAGIAVSHGSACSSGALEPSRVLINMGIPHALAKSAIRFSLSRETTELDIQICIEAVSTLLH